MQLYCATFVQNDLMTTSVYFIFYVRQYVVLSVYYSYHNSVCISVCHNLLPIQVQVIETAGFYCLIA